MPSYGKWATEAGGSIGTSPDPNPQFNSDMWVPGGPNWKTQSPAMTSMTGTMTDAPIFNQSTGMYVSSVNGQPYTGSHAGQKYQGGRVTGVEVPYSGGQTINPNDPNQRYAPVNIPKNPEISPTVQALTDTLAKSANESLQNFSTYKKQFTDSIDAAKAKSDAATNIAPLAADLNSQQARYSAALDAASRNYADVNTRTAAAERGIVQQANDTLPQYDAAAEAAANLQMNALQRQVSRYKAASGTPMSLGTNEQAMLTGGAAQILVPMEQAKINQRYNILNSLAMPSTLDIANRETAKAAQFDPMIAAQQFQTGTQTAQTIQQLKMVTSNMAYQDAVRYMQSLGVPDQLQQQIISGNISQASALNNLMSASRYQGLQDVMGAQLTPSIGTTFTAPGYPGPTRYSPNVSSPVANQPLLNAPNAPRTVSPNQNPPAGAQGSWVWDGNNNRWQNWKTGETRPASRYQDPFANDPTLDLPGVQQTA